MHGIAIIIYLVISIWKSLGMLRECETYNYTDVDEVHI